MVLYKRKPVGVTPPSEGISDNQEVWYIEATDEVFVEYEKFLKRMDFLSQKKFTDAVNGKSGLTFFAAQESETQSSHAIENVFPEVLRDPILRKVQFSTIGRMDDLVNVIFDEFKKDFFPGEDIIVVLDNGDSVPGSIREKAKFPMIRGPDGAVQREAFSRYFVRLTTQPNEEALVDDKHLRRDRKVFTKQNLRAFLKNSLQREAWNGAPWLVKEHLAIHYRLPMEIPAQLLQDFKLLQSKQQVVPTKASKGRRTKTIQVEDLVRPSVEDVRMQQNPQRPAPQQTHYTAQAIPTPTNGTHYTPGKLSATEVKQIPAVIKYPIEDLDIPPKQNGVTRPQLKFFTSEMEEYITKGRKKVPKEVQFETLAALLEIWTTLNVQAEAYVLDSFTFDDFVDAMKFQSEEVECELLNELYCAVLNQIININGKAEIKLPRVEESESEDDTEESAVVSEPQTPMDDVPAKSTRSRLSQVMPDIKSESPVATAAKVHRATELLEGFDWQDELGRRQMEDGGWQMCLVGLLNQLSYDPRLKTDTDKVLAYLVPIDEESTTEDICRRFAYMDLNLRALALQIITIQSVQVKHIRQFLETCSDDQTEVRKKKIEQQRLRRVAMEELVIKDRERKILLPDNMPGSPEPTISEHSLAQADVDDTQEDITMESGSDIEVGRTLRKNAGRKRKREEELAKAEHERAEKAAAAKAQNKQSKEFLKILKDISLIKERLVEIEAYLVDCDDDLREASVQRTRTLGTDRFCNRYYWFERNGQPFGGAPNSSTAAYGYTNGLIWVQGPDEMERQGFIDLEGYEQSMYRARFQMSVPERRKQEEGDTILENAHEWGFYDDSDRVDSLIAWLDERGDREKKLLKELKEWRDEIVKYMNIRKKFLEDEAAKKAGADEEQATRPTTRHAQQTSRSATAERCLRWHNSRAVRHSNHIHSVNPERTKAKRKSDGRGVAQVLTTRSGKPIPRR